ncbi:hypothetical protein DAD186_01780 [Dermabacter vaginalis]|uniref:Uncharacterized protein n=1 Tax=Dermabacter vaginalis TaxID=1630135 RepID=A0A1B0ZFM1_9MICO|nr:hypothetical protein DAD186_01780 [Dermabacter vaginalis]
MSITHHSEGSLGVAASSLRWENEEPNGEVEWTPVSLA